MADHRGVPRRPGREPRQGHRLNGPNEPYGLNGSNGSNQPDDPGLPTPGAVAPTGGNPLPTVGVGVLLVLLDLRVPTPAGAVDLLPDAVGWLLVFLAARRAGWSRVSGLLAALGVVSLVDEVRVSHPHWLADVQAAYQLVAVFGYVVVAAAAQAWCAERDDAVGTARYARHGHRLPFALIPAAATLFLVLTARSAGPLTMPLILLSAVAFLIVGWLAVDLLRAGRTPIGVAEDSGRRS